MLFNSFLFLFAFLPAVTLGYLLLLRLRAVALAIPFLGIASYTFYLSGEHIYPWLLAVSIAGNFLAGRLIAASERPLRGVFTGVAVGLNLLLLGYFKYSNFVLDQLHLFGLDRDSSWNVMLPVGISFYTFTQIAFLADVYSRKAEERQFFPYLLFVSYYPHLIAGPILHHSEMLPQFRKAALGRVGNDLFAGLSLFTIGLAKKVLLADSCALVATPIFSGSAQDPPSFFTAWLGALAYTFQIYFDFSGYSDMAIGASRMLGIDLPINFNSPYKATSIIGFWRRWHITLSRFLRDYLYIPLGGNRKGIVRRYINLFATMLLGGIWHGAGWTFVLWGAMHGAAQTVAHGWNDLRKRFALPVIPPLIGWALTIVFVIFAWVPFRAPDMATATSLWRGMIGFSGFEVPGISMLAFAGRLFGTQLVDVQNVDVLVTGVAALIAFFLPNSQELLREFNIGLDSPRYGARGEERRLVIRKTLAWALAMAVLLGFTLRQLGGYSEFIYFQF